MILFKGDYAKQGAIRHWTTNNDSFIKFACLLKDMGVENYDFCLALHDKDLLGIDPHDPTISQKYKVKVAIESSVNIWYFMREVARVEGHGGSPKRFELHRANAAQIWLAMCDIDQLDILPRQHGKTIGILKIINWYMHIRGKNFDVGMHAKDSDLIITNIARLKALRDLLPPYLIHSGIKDTDNNKESLDYKRRNVRCLTYKANASPKLALKHGRGGSFTLFHFDEPAYSDNIDVSYDTVVPAWSKAAEEARRNGLPCSIVMTTTPGFTQHPAGRYMYEKRSNAVRFTETFYDIKTKEKLLDIVKKNSNGIVLVEYDYKRLGSNEAWAENIRRLISSAAYNTDVLLKWEHGANTPILTAEDVSAIAKSVKDPKYIEYIDGVIINWHVTRAELFSVYKDKSLIMGGDNSDNGGSGDATTLVILDPTNLKVVGTMRCLETNLIFVAGVIFKLICRLTKVVWIPERNRAATIIDAVILKLIEANMNPFRRIYNKFVNEKGSAQQHDLTLGSVRAQFGFTTTGSKKSRPLLYSEVLSTAIMKGAMNIFDIELANELSSLVNRNGRVDHPPGGHDDLTIAYLLAAWLIMFGKNLQLYDIQISTILTDVGGDDNVKVPEDVMSRYRELKEKLEMSELSPTLRKHYEYEMSIIGPRIEKDRTSGKDIISINQEIDQNRSSNLNPNQIINLFERMNHGNS